jgi:hypothetical protein
MPREFMPILRRPDFKLPWSLIAPHERQAMVNHGQTLERLAERGGLGFTEAEAVIRGMSWRDLPLNEAASELWLRERIAAHAAGVPSTGKDQP